MYYIILGKHLRAKDVLILDSKKRTIKTIYSGSGAGSHEFGEYYSIEFENEKEIVWVYSDCPYVVEIG